MHSEMQWSHGGLFKDILHDIKMFSIKDILLKRRSVIWFIPVLYCGLEYLTSSLCFRVSMCHNFIDFLRENVKDNRFLSRYVTMSVERKIVYQRPVTRLLSSICENKLLSLKISLAMSSTKKNKTPFISSKSIHIMAFSLQS